MVEFWPARLPQCSGGNITCMPFLPCPISQNPGKTEVLPVLPLMTALTLYWCVKIKPVLNELPIRKKAFEIWIDFYAVRIAYSSLIRPWSLWVSNQIIIRLCLFFLGALSDTGPVKVNQKMAILVLRWIFFGFKLLVLETWGIKYQFWVRNRIFKPAIFFSFQFKSSGLVTEFFTSMV